MSDPTRGTDGPDGLAAARAHLEELPCFQLYLGWRRAQAYYRPLLTGGATPQRMYVLGLLLDAGRAGAGVSDVAATLDVDIASASGLLTRMEDEALVERVTADSGDRRQVRVRATRAGRARYRGLAAAIEEADRQLLADLNPADVEGLRRVVAVLGRRTANPRDENR